MEFFRYYHSVRSGSIYISRPSFIPKLSKLLHSSLVWARYGVSFVAYGFWWLSNQSFGFLLTVLCSISCYTDRDISKASCNYINEMNILHISYLHNLFTVGCAWCNWCESYNSPSFNSREVVMEPALLSLAAPWVVKTKTSSAATGARVCTWQLSVFSVRAHVHTSSRKLPWCSVLALSCGICSPKNSEKAPHGSPVRASHGVSIVDS